LREPFLRFVGFQNQTKNYTENQFTQHLSKLQVSFFQRNCCETQKAGKGSSQGCQVIPRASQ